jgi:hypothetical protein
MSVIPKDILDDLDNMIVTLAWKCPEDIANEWTCEVDGIKFPIFCLNGNDWAIDTNLYNLLSTKTICEIKSIIYYSTITPPYSYVLYNFLINLETIQKINKMKKKQQSLTNKMDAMGAKQQTIINKMDTMETKQELIIGKLNENNDLYNQINDKLVMFIGLLDIKKQNDDNAK